MKSKSLLVLLVVALSATAPASAAATANQKPQVIITVDYAPDAPADRPHLFRGWCEYLRYFNPFFRPYWP